MNKADALINLVTAMSPRGIKEQERDGQKQRTLSFDRLPRIVHGGKGRHDFESLGFVFCESLDDLFVAVTPPAGWSLQPSDHSMWSDVLDDQGRTRAKVFYKAAFYDKSAFVSLDRRYRIRHQACDEDGHRIETKQYPHDFSLCEVADYDNKCVIVVGKSAGNDWERQKLLEVRANEWLDENKPDWKNPLAYW